MKKLLVVALLAGLTACNRQETVPAAEEELPGGAITRWTDSTELFMEHPALLVGQAGKFAVHLTDLTDFAPLRSGRITLTFTPRSGGAPLVVAQDTPRAPGIYGPAPVFTAAGTYDLVIEVSSPQARDRIQVPDLHVYAKPEDVPGATEEGEAGISFLKEQQWKTPGFETRFAGTGSVARSFESSGEVIPAAGRFAEVSAPIDGMVAASGIAGSPIPGQRVARGALLAVLTPSVGEGGGSAYASARRELREAIDEHERARRLVAAEAIPARRLHEAEIRLQAARETLAGLPGGTAFTSDGTLPIQSPISGLVAQRTISPGSRVAAGQMLFSIVDPSVVWIKANLPAQHASMLDRGTTAAFRIAGLNRLFEARKLISIGGMVDPASRTVPVIYEAQNPGNTIKVGANVLVSVRTAQRSEGVVIPTVAILDEEGKSIAYVQADGETFERRELTLGGSERGLSLVLSGIRAGERVVSGAAYQIRLASLSTAVPAHGHEH
ncbi:MAG: efflux RND transporter periplasmic adaptor subunit [Gemmatimonadota bacterium]